MAGRLLDRFTKPARAGPWRAIARALLFAATAIPLTPVRIARDRGRHYPRGY